MYINPRLQTMIVTCNSKFPLYMKRRHVLLLIGMVAVVALWWWRTPLLRQIGTVLIVQDVLEEADVIIVLAGQPIDRAGHAATLYRQGLAPQLICTGGAVPPDFEAIDVTLVESDITKWRLTQLGVPDAAITQVCYATSTAEEADTLARIAVEMGLRSCIVVTNAFHSRRVKKVFRKAFRDTGVRLMVAPAPSSQYDEQEWWKYEHGLLAVNNEYVKLLYYLLKGYL